MTTPLAAGSVLGGRYRLDTPIASGGMGDVWSATDEVLHRVVAVKVMRASRDETFRARFQDEARHSAALHHPNIASVFDFGEDDGTTFLVMEFVPGRPLSDVIRDAGAMPPEQVRSIIAQAALALSAAHDAGVVHRDVKPANIMVTPDGQAKLTDFGIARTGDGSGHTLTGEVLGTPEYLSPEQALGHPATGASDLYSLGVVAHEMLTGAKPFDAGAPIATALAQVNDAPPPLPETVPLDLRAIVEACLVKSAEDRPTGARAVADALDGPAVRMPLSSSSASVPFQPSPSVTPAVTPAVTPSVTPPVTSVLRAANTSPDTAANSAANSAANTAANISAPAPTRVAAALGVEPVHDESPRRERQRAQRHTTSRWAWLAVPVVALIAWGTFAMASFLGAPATGTTSGSPRPTPAASATTPPTTMPTTRASTTATTTATEPSTPPSTEATSTSDKPGKGKGRHK